MGYYRQINRVKWKRNGHHNEGKWVIIRKNGGVEGEEWGTIGI